MADSATRPLDGIRVIDIADHRGELGGRLLADLGAEVIKVEPPGGSLSRRMAPFRDGQEGDSEGSLYWASVSLGKKSVILDIAQDGDRAKLREMLVGADIFLESFDPGYLVTLGLGYDDVRGSNPARIYVSVTPFGQDGPRTHDQATDITLQSAGGLVSLQGDQDRRPIPVGQPNQAAFHAGGQAAADAIIALNERRNSGLGQHIDVSMQTAIVWTLMNATGYPPNQGTNPPGTCEGRGGEPISQLRMFGIDMDMPTVWECKDGNLTGGFGIGGVGAKSLAAMVRWLDEEGLLENNKDLAGVNWLTWTLDLMEGRLDIEKPRRLVPMIVEFLKTRGKMEVLERAVRESMLIAPFYSTADLVADRQMEERDYWTEIAGVKHPGAIAKTTAYDLTPATPAPKLGADQGAANMPHKPVAPPPVGGERSYAFKGLKVADFAWVGVGPIIAKALADHGATVVHVESEGRPDVLRIAPPFKNGQSDLNLSQFHANFNSSKLGLACNLSVPEGQDLARKLIDWADVVLESFTPGAMERLGLGYEALSRDRPDLIMLSTCLRGQTGPHRAYAGFGGQGAALAGLHYVTGWEDRPPSGPWGAYTDFITPRYGVSVLTAAIWDRARTGKGTHIDLSQIEASIHFMEPQVLDYTVNGRITEAGEDRSPYSSPNGVFEVAGEGRYVALGCETAAQWQSLRSVVAPLAAFGDASFDELAVRQANADAIDGVLRLWFADKDPWKVTADLQAAGVPISVVEFPSDLYDDPQLTHRGFFVTMDHAKMGPTPYDGLVSKFSGMPTGPLGPGPTLGQHTAQVLSEILGLSEEEVVELAVAGVLA
ncbi:MAG TPA: CoA transferase [Tepidiformaceae bacterium]|nr:CoA transferase [Tepidiformaceae bacterium]